MIVYTAVLDKHGNCIALRQNESAARKKALTTPGAQTIKVTNLQELSQAIHSHRTKHALAKIMF